MQSVDDLLRKNSKHSAIEALYTFLEPSSNSVLHPFRPESPHETTNPSPHSIPQAVLR